MEKPQRNRPIRISAPDLPVSVMQLHKCVEDIVGVMTLPHSRRTAFSKVNGRDHLPDKVLAFIQFKFDSVTSPVTKVLPAASASPMHQTLLNPTRRMTRTAEDPSRTNRRRSDRRRSDGPERLPSLRRNQESL
jgi:hypothetical protein